MMRRWTIRIAVTLVTLLIGVFHAVGAVASSRVDLQAQVGHLQGYVQGLRRAIAVKGSPEAKQADARVDFVVTDSPFPMAQSGRESSGRMRIEMTTQFRLLLVYFEELTLVAGSAPELTPCKIEYTGMLAHLYADNLARISANEAVLAVPAPEVFAIATKARCDALEKALPVKPSARGFRDYQVNLAIAFTYLHELGHLVLGHKRVSDDIFSQNMTERERMKAFLEGMKMSRAQEYEADRFAVRELARLGAHPLEVLSPPLNDMFVATSGFDCDMRLGLTHPDPTARMRNIVHTIEVTPFHPQRELPKPADAQAFFDDLLAFYARVDSTLKCPDDDADASSGDRGR